jgi:hypothetical protein
MTEDGCTPRDCKASSRPLEAFCLARWLQLQRGRSEGFYNVSLEKSGAAMRRMIPEWMLGREKSFIEALEDAGVAAVVALVATESLRSLISSM